MPFSKKPEEPRSAPAATISDANLQTALDALTQLAGILVNPNQFVNPQGQAPPGISADLKEIFTNAKPLLDANSADTFVWLCDIWGRETIRATAAQPAQEPISVIPSGQIRKIITEVRGVNAVIQQWTDFNLDLNKLGAQLRLLDLSYTFESFELAANSYLKNAGSNPDTEQNYPNLISDKQVIVEYQKLLSQSMRAIKQAFFLAELMCTQYMLTATPAKRYNCLVLLSQELDFARLSIQEIAAVLAGYKTDSLDEHERATWQEYDKIDPSWIGNNWLTMVALGVKQRQWPQRLPDSLISDYYADRFWKLARSIKTRTPLEPPSFHALLLRVNHRVPPFSGDPTLIPLLDYAQILLPQPELDPFSLAVICALGFGAQIEQIVFDTANTFPLEAAQELVAIARQTVRSGQRVLLILNGEQEVRGGLGDQIEIRQRRGAGSLAGSWTTSSQHAVLPVFPDDNLDTRLKNFIKACNFTMVFLDGPNEPALNLWRKAGLPPSANIFQLSADTSSPTGPIPYPILVQPTGLDAAIEQALRVVPSASPRPRLFPN